MKTKIKLFFIAAMLTSIMQLSAQNTCNQFCNVSAGSNKTICCPGGSVIIGGSPCASTSCAPQYLTYSWAPSTGLSSSTVCNPTASPLVTTTYTLYVTFSKECCCDGGTGNCAIGSCPSIQRSATVKVTVNNTCCRLISPDQEKEEVNSEINLFPNPTEGKFSLQFNQLVSGTCIIIYDANGKQVMLDANLDVNRKQFDYDLSAMAKGIYYVKVIEGENTLYLKKIVLQ